MQPVQTEGPPPKRGRTSFAARGSAMKISAAPAKTASAGTTLRATATQVRAVLGRDADDLALVDERRDLHDEPGLHGRGLLLRRGRGALDAGRGLDDLQVHRRRHLDAD